MANDISAFGIRVTLRASKTFPASFGITQFADDADPVDIPSQQLADAAMGANGDLISWAKANPVPLSINVIPGSDDDKNLAILAEANRVGRGKKGARDNITAVITYPDGSVLTLTNGRIMDGQLGNSAASSGRLKSKAYQFKFENRVGV